MIVARRAASFVCLELLLLSFVPVNLADCFFFSSVPLAWQFSVWVRLCVNNRVRAEH